jgi:hypothetical protein
MRAALNREFDSLRREVEGLREAQALHFEARINNLERRIERDLVNAEKRIEDLRAELSAAIGENTTRIAALERGEAGSHAVDDDRERAAARMDNWKLAILGAGITVIVFLANLLTSGN